MTMTGNRYRERSSPMPVNNKQLAGNLNIYHKVTGAFVGIKHVQYTPTAVYPMWREKTWDFKHPGPPFLSGGPFANIYIEFPTFNVQAPGSYATNNSVGSWTYRYDGGFHSPLWVGALDTIAEADYYNLNLESDSILLPDLASLADAAYARLRPSLTKVNLGVTIAEMRDLPRMLKTTASGFHGIWKNLNGDIRSNSMAPRKAANHFINTQFGWIPFLDDMHKMFDAYYNSHHYFAQAERDNDKWVRRIRRDKTIESETLLYSRNDIHGCQPSNAGDYFGIITGPVSYTIKLQSYTEVWYEGSFKYFRPEFEPDYVKNNPNMSAVKRHMELHGLNISPTLIWKATPWSWAADWFSNSGDLIQRAEDWATDSLVSKYMYLMHRHRRRFELRSRFTTSNGVSHDLVWYRSAEIKRRESASSHFSFHLSADLTGRQKAILLALGMGRRIPSINP